jgi:hypothetical protein
LMDGLDGPSKEFKQVKLDLFKRVSWLPRPFIKCCANDCSNG